MFKQHDRDKYYDLIYMWNLKNKLISTRNRLVVARGEEWVGNRWMKESKGTNWKI